MGRARVASEGGGRRSSGSVGFGVLVYRPPPSTGCLSFFLDFLHAVGSLCTSRYEYRYVVRGWLCSFLYYLLFHFPFLQCEVVLFAIRLLFIFSSILLVLQHHNNKKISDHLLLHSFKYLSTTSLVLSSRHFIN